jgi:Na+-driven multidrug efflux pump
MKIFISDGTYEEFHDGVLYLRAISVFYVLCYISNVYVGYFRGRGNITVPVFGTVIQMAVRVIISYTFIARTGLSAVAYATGAGWICIVLFHSFMFFKITKVKKYKIKKIKTA